MVGETRTTLKLGICHQNEPQLGMKKKTYQTSTQKGNVQVLVTLITPNLNARGNIHISRSDQQVSQRLASDCSYSLWETKLSELQVQIPELRAGVTTMRINQRIFASRYQGRTNTD